MSERLRIGYVGTAWPMRGGLAQYNALLSTELAKEHDVELVSFTRQYPSLLFPGKTQLDSSEEPVRFPATPLVDSIQPWSWGKAAHHLARFRPDGLVFKYWMPFFAPAFGAIARGVQRRVPEARVVVILDNLIPHERRPLDRLLTRWFMKPVDAWICQSSSVREDLLSMDPKARYLEVPHPIFDVFGERCPKAEARASLGLPVEGQLLLFFGFVRKYKGLDLLLEALPIARREVPVRVLVAGEFYGGRADIDAQIARLGIQDAVLLRDEYVPNEAVARWFSAADAVVLPYRSATQSGIVPIAWACERPVLCTDVGGLSEVVHDGRLGLVVPPEDPKALAEAIVRFYREQLEEPFTEAIRAEKEKYSWAHMAAAVTQLIREPRA